MAKYARAITCLFYLLLFSFHVIVLCLFNIHYILVFVQNFVCLAKCVFWKHIVHSVIWSCVCFQPCFILFCVFVSAIIFITSLLYCVFLASCVFLKHNARCHMIIRCVWAITCPAIMPSLDTSPSEQTIWTLSSSSSTINNVLLRKWRFLYFSWHESRLVKRLSSSNHYTFCWLETSVLSFVKIANLVLSFF